MYDSNSAGGRKSMLYNNLVNSLSLQAYLTKPIPFQYRKAVAKLGHSSHCLAIETGRYTNILHHNVFALYVKWTLKTNITLFLYVTITMI